MAESTVRLANGQRWTARQFLDHYRSVQISGTPTPVGDAPYPVDVDRSWYMGEGPGRYYHPGMFPIVHRIADNRNLAPGTYDLAKLANEDNDLNAKISHYTTDMSSADYPLRALVFGNESAKISGQVVVNPDRSKTFKQIEIRPLDTNFDFEHNTRNVPLELAREIARKKYDSENQGVRYEIQYRGPGPDRGTGRIYDPFSDSQLNAALHKEFVYPRSAPPWLLPSITGKPPLPFVEEQRQYLDQTSGTQASSSHAGHPALRFVPPANRNSSSNDIGNWLASLAGIDPSNPTQPAPPPQTGSNSVPRLVRVNSNPSPASVFDTKAPAVPFVPPAHPNSLGGMPGLGAAMAGVDPQNPTQAAPSPQFGGASGISNDKSVPHLSRRYGNNSPASAPEPSAPAAWFVLPGPPNSSGGLADWIAALAGVNPPNPTQPASPPQDQLRGFYRDDPVQPWTLQRRR
jgi:hypothetical protein